MGIYGPSGLSQRGSQARNLLCKPTCPLKREQLQEKESQLAKVVAQYRSGDYGSIDRYHAENTDHETNQASYGLTRIYMHINLAEQIEQLNKANATLLLNPENREAVFMRARIHEWLGWNEMAAADLTTAIGTLESEYAATTYLSRAGAWARDSMYQKILENLEGMSPGQTLRTDALVALAHWQVGDLAAATERIDAADYGDPAALFGLKDDANSLNVNSYRGQSTTHLAMKGALKAARGDLDDGLKYLYMPSCNERLKYAEPEDIPQVQNIYQLHENPLKQMAESLARDWFRGRHYSQAWSAAEEARAVWEWCDYPAEFTSDPEAGLWATLAMRLSSANNSPPRPQTESYSLDANHTDAIVTGSDNPATLHYIAAWAHNGLAWSTDRDTLHDITRSLDLGNDHPEAHRIKAEAHLAMAVGGRHPFLILEDAERRQWVDQQYQEAVDAYATYESLASPKRLEAARFHFAQGNALHRSGQKDEAAKAFQMAFELGYDEEEVRQALIRLNQ